MLDANIVFDFMAGGLLDDLFRLPLTYCTPDLLLANDIVHPPVHRLLGLGLEEHSLSGEQLLEIIALRQQYGALTLSDISAFWLARHLNIGLLTGDRRLRELAEKSGIEVHGTLWLLEWLMTDRLMAFTQLETALRDMEAAGRRLPRPKRDTAEMQAHYLDEDEEKRVRKAFRDPAQDPKLLIVTQKLLTGFDAPVAYVMYLDKPLKDHTLLQAIARVNRPYPDKSSGLVVDYIGVFRDLQRALNFDQGGLDRGLIDLAQLRVRFADLMAQVWALLEPPDPRRSDRRTEQLIAYFYDEEPRAAFLTLCKDLQMAYEVLSPDPFLRDYLDDYALVMDIFQTVQSYFNPKGEQQRMEREFRAKTEQLILTNGGGHM